MMNMYDNNHYNYLSYEETSQRKTSRISEDFFYLRSSIIIYYLFKLK